MQNSTKKWFLLGCSGFTVIFILAAVLVLWLFFNAVQTINNTVAGGYVVSDGKVTYYAGLGGFGPPQSWEIKEADAPTFKNIGEGYAADKNIAYFEGISIPQSDGASFQITQVPYAKDKNHVFYTNQIVSDAPANFKFLDQNGKDSFVTDGKIIFRYGSPVFPETLDVATFEVINSNYFKDKNHVYTFDKIIEGADPQTFRALADYEGNYAEDKTHVYFKNVKVKDCDAATHKIINQSVHRDAHHVFFGYEKVSDDAENFQILTPGYSKDGKYVYWSEKKISDDAAHFTAFPSIAGAGYAKDDKNVYWCDKKLPQADVNTFVGLNYRYGKDKNQVWFGVGEENLPEIVKNADADSFELTPNSEYDARDKNNIINFGFIRGPR